MSENNKLPKHSSVARSLTWDLKALYPSREKWEEDFKSIDAYVDSFLTCRGKLSQSPQMLKEAFDRLDELERILEKVYTYAHLKSDEDTACSKNRELIDRISARFAEIEGKIAWFEPEIMAIDEDKINSFIAAGELSFYRRSLEQLMRFRAHTLSDKEERILGMSSECFAVPGKTFSVLNNADLKFPDIKDENGKLQHLSHGNYINFLENADREVRKGAFNAMYDSYHGLRNTFSTTLGASVKNHVLSAKLRNYPSALEASLYGDKVDVRVYNQLIETVHSKLNVLHDYFKLRSRVMNLEALDMYDIYNPLLPECKINVSWKEAAEWVEEALKPMGQQYSCLLKKAFSERWIDVMECKGKRSGAYSSGCYDSYPYLLLNFTGTLSDVFTLAHELGHSMHSYYSNHAQEYHYASYRIFVAEVASTCNEMLLHEHLIKTKGDDKKLRAYLLCHLADQIRGTIYRQTMFAEFEKLIHELAEKNIPLTPDRLSDEYEKLNKLYHGKFVVPDKKIAMEWARIPHFYYNFYVYKYATGLSAAIALSQRILSGEKDKIDAYFDFLKAGDSKDVLDIMRDAGVDLSTAQPVSTALELLKRTVAELNELL